jgi:3-phenylpropionate/trans-cinnamate dioxygenase ferredoxin reductase subunit
LAALAIGGNPRFPCFDHILHTMTTTPQRTLPMVIVGAGHVGGRAALALREGGWAGDIVLIGAETHLPYERPPLSKGVLTGEQTAASCQLGGVEALADKGIQHRHARVTAIDAAAREVTLNDSERLPYSALLLATGGTLRQLSIPGAELPGVLGLRTLDDAAALSARLTAGSRLVIIGGGFIGLEVAASARKRGCAVTVVEGAPRLLGRAVPERIGAQVLALHRAQGVDVRLGHGPTQIDAVDAAEGALSVLLDNGKRLPADTVVVGIGIEPDVALARAAGLTLGRGIRVNADLSTSAPGIWAAGDVVEFPSAVSGQPIRQETWHNAETQAQLAARNMLGAQERYAATPWFWSDQYGHQLQVTGEPALAARVVERALGGEAENEAHIGFHLDADGRVVGVSGFGPASAVVKELKLARVMVERGSRPDAAALADPAVKLKSLW